MAKSKVVVGSKETVMRVTVELNGKKYWKRYYVENGKVPKVAKDGLQEMVDDCLE